MAELLTMVSSLAGSLTEDQHKEALKFVHQCLADPVEGKTLTPTPDAIRLGKQAQLLLIMFQGVPLADALLEASQKVVMTDVLLSKVKIFASTYLPGVVDSMLLKLWG